MLGSGMRSFAGSVPLQHNRSICGSRRGLSTRHGSAMRRGSGSGLLVATGAGMGTATVTVIGIGATVTTVVIGTTIAGSRLT